MLKGLHPRPNLTRTVTFFVTRNCGCVTPTLNQASAKQNAQIASAAAKAKAQPKALYTVSSGPVIKFNPDPDHNPNTRVPLHYELRINRVSAWSASCSACVHLQIAHACTLRQALLLQSSMEYVVIPGSPRRSALGRSSWLR